MFRTCTGLLGCLLTATCLPAAEPNRLEVKKVEPNGLAIYRPGAEKPLLVQNARPDKRAYIHPLLATDGKTALTVETVHNFLHGISFNIQSVNGINFRQEESYFHPRPLAEAVVEGNRVSWKVVTDWQAKDQPLALTETQEWTFADRGDHQVLDLHWHGKAAVDLTLSSPHACLLAATALGKDGSIRNSEGTDLDKRSPRLARWQYVSQPSGNLGLALLDHPSNRNYPTVGGAKAANGILAADPIHGGTARLARDQVLECRYRFVTFADKNPTERVEAFRKEYAR